MPPPSPAAASLLREHGKAPAGPAWPPPDRHGVGGIRCAGFDYVENLGLGISLWGDPASPWPQVAFVAALLKFAAIYSALLYALSGMIGALLARRL